MMYDALYGRQSIEKKDSISVESQLEYCKYETHGAPYIEYADRGYSGKNTNRPDFERMMTDIKDGKIKRSAAAFVTGKCMEINGKFRVHRR